MQQNKCEMAVVILAAGQGKRMAATYPDKPKVLVEIGGKPFIIWLMDSIKESKIAEKVILVIGHKGGEVKKILGSSYEYVEQLERLGTGHAVSVTEQTLAGVCDNIMILYGDHPFVKPETLRALKNLHISSGAYLSMVTAKPENFEGWRRTFADFGRIIRNEKGEIIRLVEKKDATEDELAVREVNLGMYVFRASWLWPHLRKLERKNVQNEYYLTDLIKMATEEGAHILATNVDPKEGIGFNTPEQVLEAETLLKEL